MAVLLFGASKNINNSHNQLKIHHHTDSCCKNCGDENCNCCDNHKKNDTGDSDNCGCQVSKDADDRPSSLPESFKLTDYYFFHANIDFPTESILKHLYLSNLNSSKEYYNSFKAETSTVIRI
ncbi:MAG: hypothetical protein M1480_17900 [Bacteroidetes bacterium]|nr:hypothetical protein [Bacteroidota bacterium]